MAWLARNNFTAGEAMSHAYLNALANDIRAWGGDVNAGGFRLANIVGITATSNKLAIGTDTPTASVDIAGGGTLWTNGNALYQQFVAADRTIQMKSATQAAINLVSDIDVNEGVVGGVYFGRSGGQADAHRTIAGIKGNQDGSGSFAGGSLSIIVKGSGASGEVTRFTAAGVGVGTKAPIYQVHVYGVGQATSALTDAGGFGGSLYLQDSLGAGGNGGALVFGALQGRFAAIKGMLQDGAANTLGHVVISTRAATGDTAMTERVRITYQGRVGIGKANPGTNFAVVGLPVHADNAAATGAGLTAGDTYRTPAGLMGYVF